MEFLEDGQNISEEISVADTEDIREHIQELNENADKVNVEGNTVEDVLSVISGISHTIEKKNNKNIEDDVKCRGGGGELNHFFSGNVLAPC